MTTEEDFATNEAAMLEPLAIEEMQYGTFTYAVGASETKWCVNAWNVRLGSGGRFDIRDPRQPVPLRNITMTGLTSTSTGVFIDPTLATYSDPKTTLFDRYATLPTLATKYLPFVAADTYETLIPGPYGTIITGISLHDTTWLIADGPKGVDASWNLSNEIGDATADDQRVGHRMYVPVSKNVLSGITRGAAGSPDTPLAGLTYVILPSTWGKVTDSNTYSFRDDFMGSSLDTATTWTRTQSTAGNVEINTNFAACKLRGNGSSWSANGLFSQSGVAVSAGVTFECDFYVGEGADGSNAASMVVGFHDGAGHDFSDFAHALLLTVGSGAVKELKVYENGTMREIVGSGWTDKSLYRARITLDGSGGATYEIQGGPEYEALGGSTWTNVTSTTSSSATDPVHAGASAQGAFDHYICDPKIYT